VFDILRKAREERHMTLADVADATLINLQHLQALEEGRTDILPEAYIRAFMREYAGVVGLDAKEVMRLYDAELKADAPSLEAEPAETESQTVSSPGGAPAAVHSALFDSGHYTRTAVVLLLLGIGAVVTWNIFSVRSSTDRKIPFRDLVRENEQRVGVPAGAGSGFAEGGDSAHGLITGQDSLTLTAKTTDSVWIRMMIDDTAPREYLLRPNAKITWRGANQFLFFTIGNAGAFQLFLNGKDLGTAGKPGRVVQELVVNRNGVIPPDSLQQSRATPLTQ
jgi:transcriptional regulator with XRE-family HTH domain